MLIIDQVPRDSAPLASWMEGPQGLRPWPPTESGGAHLGPGEERTLALEEDRGNPNVSPTAPRAQY